MNELELVSDGLGGVLTSDIGKVGDTAEFPKKGKTRKNKPAKGKKQKEEKVALRTKAQDAALDKFNTVYKEFETAQKSVGKGTVATVNLGRQLGILLETIAGKKQLDLDFFTEHLKGKIPCKLEDCRLFTKIAKACPKPVKDVATAFQVSQLALRVDGVLALPEREEKQEAMKISDVQRFFANVGVIKKLADKAGDLTLWDKPALTTFLEDTAWLAEKRKKAEELLAA